MDSKEDIKTLCSASIIDNTLLIGVENLGELTKLIADVKEKENALHSAVRNLEVYQLKISFVNK